jgi:predicted  nucleic acid-binding Zn-ribbon protein
MSLKQQLMTLHRVNTQVTGLRQRLDSAERFLNAQQRVLDELDQQAEELRRQVRQLEAISGNLETESKGIAERVEKLRLDLNASKNDKQYQAILADVKSLQGKRDEIETQALGHMERAEALRAQLATLQSSIDERTTVRDRAKADLDQRHADVGERLGQLEEEREQAARAIPPDVRKIFERVASETEGEAMAPVIEISRRHREYACGACNLEIPKESFSRLAGPAEAVVQCKACTRILYIAEGAEVAVGE